jgi:carboxyl-terminal processing protease
MSVFERVRSEYVEQVDDKTLLRGAIDGMLNSLDPHSSYLDEKGFKALMTTTEGNYGGLGLTVTHGGRRGEGDRRHRGHARHRAGIKAGDSSPTSTASSSTAARSTRRSSRCAARRAPASSITVVRPGRDKPFDVTHHPRDHRAPAVKWEVKDRSASSTSTPSTATTTDDGALAAIAAIEKSLGGPPLGYVLDLRSNPGGLLDQAVEPFRRVPRARRGRLAARPQEGRHRALLCQARRRRQAACRSSCWSTPAALRRPRSSPARSRSITARS